jgi:tetratricopeptide (TPR) repeat protein
MKKQYFILCLALFGLTTLAMAQPKSPAPAPVYTGPSAAGDMKRDKGDFNGAITDYTTEINKIDAEARRIVKLKADFEKMSEFDRMSANQDEIKKNYSDWAKLYYGRAMANMGLQKKADAIPDLDLAIGLDATMSDAFYQRAMCTNNGTTKEQACVDMSRAMSLGHEKAKVAFDDNFCWNTALQHYKEGCSKLTVRKYQEALDELNKAIALCPDSGGYYAKRGQAYLGLKNEIMAVEDFTRATEKSPQLADGWYQLALHQFNKDDHELAFVNFTKALERDPLNYDAFMHRAQCCERMNKMTSAIYDYGQAISIRPQDPEAYYRRGLVERDLKDNVNACKDFRKASSLGHVDAAEYVSSDCK